MDKEIQATLHPADKTVLIVSSFCILLGVALAVITEEWYSTVPIIFAIGMAATMCIVRYFEDKEENEQP